MSSFTCSQCKVEKSSSDYYWTNSSERGVRRISPCRACQKINHQQPHARKRRAEASKRSAHKLIRSVIDKLGGCCACCGESNFLFLTLDHIDNSGSTHRRSRHKKGEDRGNTAVYRDVVAQGYPTDRYRVMCFNCNCGRVRNNGICPHQSAR